MAHSPDSARTESAATSPHRPLTGGTRPPETVASEPRRGQVPQTGRAAARLCVLSADPRAGSDEGALVAEARRLAGLGFAVGLGLDPEPRTRLGWKGLASWIHAVGAAAPAHGFVAGASMEQVGGAASIGDQLEAVVEQCAAIEAAGGVPLLLPLAALSRRRAREEEYVEAYQTVLARVAGPVLLDWTGPRVRPELLDYFPGQSFERVLTHDPAKVRGARFALLDVAREVRLRRACTARDQVLFSADRAHLAWMLLGANPGTPPARVPVAERFTELAGQPVGLGEFSHAILPGSFAQAEALAAALERLAAGDADGAFELLSALS